MIISAATSLSCRPSPGPSGRVRSRLVGMAFGAMRHMVIGLIIGTLATLLVACGDRYVTLFGGLSETEANRLVAHLDSQGVRSLKVPEREGTAVTVASSQLALASRLANQAGLPRTQYKGFGTVFPKDGLISSPLEERARLTFAVSQELEAMLADIPGVLGARVNVVIPERRNGRNTELPAAAVLIRYRSDLETDLLEMKVRRLVASSVPGLVEADARQISVTFLPVETVASASRSVAVQAAAAGSDAVLATSLEAGEATGKTRPFSAVFTWLGVGLGLLAAVLFVAWMLKDQLKAMFDKKAPSSTTT